MMTTWLVELSKTCLGVSRRLVHIYKITNYHRVERGGGGDVTAVHISRYIEIASPWRVAARHKTNYKRKTRPTAFQYRVDYIPIRRLVS